MQLVVLFLVIFLIFTFRKIISLVAQAANERAKVLARQQAAKTYAQSQTLDSTLPTKLRGKSIDEIYNMLP
jgi:hypothetical protein